MVNTLTHRQVARHLGISLSGVSRIRNGHRLPCMTTVMKIDETYGFDAKEQLQLIVHGTPQQYLARLEEYLALYNRNRKRP